MPHDAIWLVILATTGAILGSAVSFLTRVGFLRSFLTGIIVAVGLGLLLQWAGIRLPFQGTLVAFVRAALDQISGLFAQLVRR